MERWSNKNAILEIYPRSYFDANNDGVGDLKGITQKLDYIKGAPESLGIDAVWITPFYRSPMKDFGYDVANYQEVDPIFGTIEDFDELIEQAHVRGIAVMVDFVPNHTSSEHPWFQEALTSSDNDKRDFYIFRDPLPDGTPPNNWLSVFGGSAWEFHEETGQYYLHSFLPEQPDLNWENPHVQEEMGRALRFWFDKGVDGVRVDAIRWMGKDLELRDDPLNPNFVTGEDPYHIVRHENSRFSPQLDKYLGYIAAVAEEYDDRIVLWEDHLDDLTPVDSQVKRIYDISPEVAAPFNFQAMHIDFSARSFAKMVNDYQQHIPEGAHTYYCFGNHDESRLATRFGAKQARMLAVLQLTLPGTPVIYYGQELGMQDAIIADDQIRDPFELRVPGRGLGRDPERTPMQWANAKHAGFTEAERPWLPVATDYQSVNVQAENHDCRSSLALYRDILRLRTDHEVFKSANYRSAYEDDDLFCYWRSNGHETFLIALNFSEKEVRVSIPEGGSVIISAQGNIYDGNLRALGPLDGIIIRYA